MITCDYCAAQATRVTLSDEPLCQPHAREHYESDWRAETRKLGQRAAARLAPVPIPPVDVPVLVATVVAPAVNGWDV
jgi:hypothetical protein